MVNEIIDGKYQIISKIGSGGTSVVYKAERLADGKLVAIKVIRGELENIKEHERYFRLEAEALNKMSHRNVRRILGVGQWNDSLYMATEYIDGKTLKEIVSEGPLDTKTALDYALQIIAGIEHAHRRDIIHRDIKPQNIIVANDGNVKIVDFGIARMTSQTTRTMAGKDVVGSVHYLSPEQARGAQVDNRSDIYSFGIMLYEMFTGRVPFEGDEAVSIAMRHVNQIPDPPQSINPDITSGMNDIILKCIQKDPAQRYQTATELREDLLLYVGNPAGFKVINARSLQGREKAEEPESVTPVRSHKRPESNQGSVRRKVTYVNEDERKKDRASQGRRLAGIILGAVASLLVIAIVLMIVFSKFIGKDDSIENKLPDVSGFSKNVAITLLTGESFLKYRFVEEESTTVTAGNVIRTEPEAGQMCDVNDTIVIYISKGAKAFMAKNTVGMNVSEAEKELKAQGLQVSFVYVEDPDKENGTVVEQSNATEAVKQGMTITLTVVRNIETLSIVVPNIVGMTDINEIKAKITEAGCQVGKIDERSVTDPSLQGVSWQSIEAGKVYYYVEGDTVPVVVIDFDINMLKNLYECTFEYEMPEQEIADFELLIYNSAGEEIHDPIEYLSTSKVVYTYTSSKPESIIFELYNKSLRIYKVTLQTELVQENADG